MKTLLRLLPLALCIGFAQWLGTAEAQAALPVAAGITAESLQQMGQTIIVLIGVLATVCMAGLPVLYRLRKKYDELEFKRQQDNEDRLAASRLNKEHIAQINAVAPTPVLTIDPPKNPPVVDPPK